MAEYSVCPTRVHGGSSSSLSETVLPGYMVGCCSSLSEAVLLEGWSFELCLKRQEDSDQGSGILVGLEDMIGFYMTSVHLPRCAGRHEPVDTDVLALQWFLPPGFTFEHIFP